MKDTDMTPKERIYATLNNEKRDRIAVTPIFMAWAAHYIKHTYRDYYLDGGILSRAQGAVTRDFRLDQISAISDPWREASGFGMEFDYPDEGVGIPKDTIIHNAGDINKLQTPSVSQSPRMQQRINSIRSMAEEFGQTHSVLGWIEGPIAEYADLRGVSETMMDFIDNPRMYHEAAEIIVPTAIDFAQTQIEAGADMIGIGDAVASLVGPDIYSEHVLPYEKKIIEAIHGFGAAVKLHICGNINDIIADMAQTGADIIDADWMVPLSEARRKVGPEITLCGNIDPAEIILRGTPEMVAEKARECIRDGGEKFILMPGCEVPPGTPEANLRAFCPGDDCLVWDALKL